MTVLKSRILYIYIYSILEIPCQFFLGRYVVECSPVQKGYQPLTADLSETASIWYQPVGWLGGVAASA